MLCFLESDSLQMVKEKKMRKLCVIAVLFMLSGCDPTDVATGKGKKSLVTNELQNQITTGLTNALNEAGITGLDMRNATVSTTFTYNGSSVPLVNVVITATVKKPVVEIRVARFSVYEADKAGKEIIDEEIEFDETGKKPMKLNKHHEIPAKVSAVNQVLNKLLEQTPYAVVLLIVLLLIGVLIYAKFFRRK